MRVCEGEGRAGGWAREGGGGEARRKRTTPALSLRSSHTTRALPLARSELAEPVFLYSPTRAMNRARARVARAIVCVFVCFF